MLLETSFEQSLADILRHPGSNSPVVSSTSNSTGHNRNPHQHHSTIRQQQQQQQQVAVEEEELLQFEAEMHHHHHNNNNISMDEEEGYDTIMSIPKYWHDESESLAVTVYSFIKAILGSSGNNQGAIDNRIEQAMDLVKTHLMNAVRNEVEELKERIMKLEDTIATLQAENAILRAHATPEALHHLQQHQL